MWWQLIVIMVHTEVCYLTGMFIFPDYKGIFMCTMLQAHSKQFLLARSGAWPCPTHYHHTPCYWLSTHLAANHGAFWFQCRMCQCTCQHTHVRPASMRVHYIYTLKSGLAKTRPARPLAMAMCYHCRCTYHLCVHVLPHLSSHRMVGLHW